MFGSLLRRKHWPIALDLGTDSVRMLQVQQVGAVFSVLASARWRYPDGALDPQQRRKYVIEAVATMLRDNPFRGRRVVTCIPSGRLSIKNIRLPKMAAHELAQAIQWEAKERFGFEVTPDTLSFLNAGEVRQGTETRDEIIMMAANPATVEEHLTLLDDMGLRPENIEPEPVALFRGFERFLRRREDEPAVSVILDIGRSGTRVLVARGRQIVFVKSIDIGGQKLNEAIGSHLNLTPQEASELRTRLMRPQFDGVPAAPDPQSDDATESLTYTVRNAMRPQVEELGTEVGLCLRYCSVTFRGLRPDRITLTGGEAHDPNLASLLGENLSIPCKVGQPLRGVEISALEAGNRRGMLAEWGICSGLAIRNIDAKSIRESEHGERRLSA